jgi:hypothetical protein
VKECVHASSALALWVDAHCLLKQIIIIITQINEDVLFKICISKFRHTSASFQYNFGTGISKEMVG